MFLMLGIFFYSGLLLLSAAFVFGFLIGYGGASSSSEEASLLIGAYTTVTFGFTGSLVVTMGLVVTVLED